MTRETSISGMIIDHNFWFDDVSNHYWREHTDMMHGFLFENNINQASGHIPGLTFSDEDLKSVFDVEVESISL